MRVKDLDFQLNEITIRDGKGQIESGVGSSSFPHPPTTPTAALAFDTAITCTKA